MSIITRYFFRRTIRNHRNNLINKIIRCKEELNKWNDIPLSWQLGNLCDIWHPETKGVMGTNGRPQAMLKDFAMQIMMTPNNDEAIERFAKSLPEWDQYYIKKVNV